MTGRVSTLFLVIFGLFFVAACSNAKHYEMKGQVLAVDRDKVEILVKHEDIPGLMSAMTMPYKVESVTMLDNLGPGDLISTDLAVDNGTGVITKITKTGTAKVDTPAPSPNGARPPAPEMTATTSSAVAQSPDHSAVARSPDRATRPDRRSPKRCRAP